MLSERFTAHGRGAGSASCTAHCTPTTKHRVLCSPGRQRPWVSSLSSPNASTDRRSFCRVRVGSVAVHLRKQQVYLVSFLKVQFLGICHRATSQRALHGDHSGRTFESWVLRTSSRLQTGVSADRVSLQVRDGLHQDETGFSLGSNWGEQFPWRLLRPLA